MAPPGGGAGGAEAQSRRFPAEGQQQLRSAAGEGGTQPSLPSKAPAPAWAPCLARSPPHCTAAAERTGEDVSRRAAPASVPGDAPAPPPCPPPRHGSPSGEHSPQAAQAGTARPSPRPLRASPPPRERSQRRLVRTAEAPSSAQSGGGGGGSGSSQHPGPRTRNYFPTCSLSLTRHSLRLHLL